jgi:hypothetical protein
LRANRAPLVYIVHTLDDVLRSAPPGHHLQHLMSAVGEEDHANPSNINLVVG